MPKFIDLWKRRRMKSCSNWESIIMMKRKFSKRVRCWSEPKIERTVWNWKCWLITLVLKWFNPEQENEGEVDTWEAQSSEESKHLQKRQVLVLHVDIIKDPFWQRYPNLLLPLDEVKKARKRQLQTDCNKNKDEYFHFLNLITIMMKLYFIFLVFEVILKQ